MNQAQWRKNAAGWKGEETIGWNQTIPSLDLLREWNLGRRRVNEGTNVGDEDLKSAVQTRGRIQCTG